MTSNNWSALFAVGLLLFVGLLTVAILTLSGCATAPSRQTHDAPYKQRHHQPARIQQHHHPRMMTPWGATLAGG
jgi:hypothetical protein